MQPAVSVILPTYNRLHFLRAAVASVFAQTFGDWELVIADDGSDAETKSYLRGIDRPPQVRVIWLAHCGRPAAVRNAALRDATGEYFAFLDSDDLWHPRKLEIQIRAHAHPAACDWSYTGFSLVDAAGNPLGPRRNRDYPALSGWILENLLKTDTVIALPSVMVARDLIERVGPFNEDLIMCEDYELWLRMAAEARAHGIEDVLTLVRRHHEHSGSDVLAWRERRRVVESVLQHCGDARLTSVLRQLRAELSAGLARSQATYGQPREALSTLIASAPYAARYRGWWLGAMAAGLRVLAPAAARRMARGWRQRYFRARTAEH
jgi:glycosyltransferase involved in cell wall biosynthesis